MAKKVKALGFRGMNNLPKPPAKFLDEEGRVTPRVILNATVSDSGVLEQRPGYAKVVNLTGCHSLWAGSVMLCVATGAAGGPALFRIEGQTASELAAVDGPPGARMEFVEQGGLVYLSNGYWARVYDVAAGTVRAWGLSLPPAPRLDLVEGDLPPGAYSVCFTRYADGRLGGNGQVSRISFTGGAKGIRLINLPADCLAWITQPNGGAFFLATVGAGGAITSPYYAQPLPTLSVMPPPALTCLFAFAGRLWGASGKKLYYSEEFQFENFKLANTFPFPEDIVLAAPFNEGVYVNSLDKTWLLKGADPAKMGLELAGIGAIPGTLVYVRVEGGGYEISKKLSQLPSPAWMSPTGIVLGTQTGHIVYLTENRLRCNTKPKGAACHWMLDGKPHTVFTLHGAPGQVVDASLQEIFSRGRIFISAPVSQTARGGVTFGSDNAVA